MPALTRQPPIAPSRMPRRIPPPFFSFHRPHLERVERVDRRLRERAGQRAGNDVHEGALLGGGGRGRGWGPLLLGVGGGGGRGMGEGGRVRADGGRGAARAVKAPPPDRRRASDRRRRTVWRRGPGGHLALQLCLQPGASGAHIDFAHKGDAPWRRGRGHSATAAHTAGCRARPANWRCSLSLALERQRPLPPFASPGTAPHPACRPVAGRTARQPPHPHPRWRWTRPRRTPPARPARSGGGRRRPRRRAAGCNSTPSADRRRRRRRVHRPGSAGPGRRPAG